MYYCSCNTPYWQGMSYAPYPYYPNTYPYSYSYPTLLQDEPEEGKFPEVPEEDDDHACLPLDEFGIPASVCASVDVKAKTASVYLRIAGFEDITIGQVSMTKGIVNADIGATISGLGIGAGWGITLNVKVNTNSGCISACVQIDYGIGSVAPVYGIIGGTCLQPLLT